MEFETFGDIITKQIHTPSTVKYGSVGSKYLVVLAFIDGKFVELGRLIYNIWRETLYAESNLIAFGKECEDFRLGLRTTMPVWCWRYDNDPAGQLTWEDEII